MGKKSPKAPAPPDPNVTAAAQTNSNIATAITNAELNRINQVTPYGNLTYYQNTTPRTFADRVLPTQKLDPTSFGVDAATWEKAGREAGFQDQYGGGAFDKAIASDPLLKQKFLNILGGQGAKLPDGSLGENRIDWTSQTTLNPADQKLLDTQRTADQSLADIGVAQLGRLNGNLSQPLDFSGLPNLVTGLNTSGLTNMRRFDVSDLAPLLGANDLQGERQRVEDAVYDRYASRLNPQYEKEQRNLETQLANMGITRGSEAFRNAMDDFARRKTDDYDTARRSAVTSGGDELSRLFGISLQGRQQGVGERAQASQIDTTQRQQGVAEQVQNAALAANARERMIQEQLLKRNQPLNEITALLGAGQIQPPQFSQVPQVQMPGVDYGSLVNTNYQGQLNNYNQQLASRNATQGSIFGLAGTALGAGLMPGGWLLSDRRAKTGVKRVGTLDNGIPVYAYRYKGEKVTQIGVMAQDVEKVKPHAVHQIGKFKHVNYSMAVEA